MSRLTRDGTAEPVSRDQILRRERGQGNINFPCSADHVQDWQPYPIDPYSCYMCDHTYVPYMMFNRVQCGKIETESLRSLLGAKEAEAASVREQARKERDDFVSRLLRDKERYVLIMY